MITMTYKLAMAAGRDAANRRMRKAGRTKWTRGDYNEAARTFARLYSVSEYLAEHAQQAVQG